MFILANRETQNKKWHKVLWCITGFIRIYFTDINSILKLGLLKNLKFRCHHEEFCENKTTW